MPITKKQNGKYVVEHKLDRLEDLHELQKGLINIISHASSSDNTENFDFGMTIYQMAELLKSTLLDENQLREFENSQANGARTLKTA